VAQIDALRAELDEAKEKNDVSFLVFFFITKTKTLIPIEHVCANRYDENLFLNPF
jgi:hypothetical protein